MKLLLAYLVIINAVGFLFMLIDKRKAQKNLWRIPEKVLLGLAICGGSIGTFLGMNTFRHKTKKFKFSLGLPVILALQVLLSVFILIWIQK